MNNSEQINDIKNHDTLLRRAKKQIEDFDEYPVIPNNVKDISEVFNYNPLYVLNDLKKRIMNLLLEKTNYEYEENILENIINEAYNPKEKFLQKRILNQLIVNSKDYFNHISDVVANKYTDTFNIKFNYTPIYYYSYSIFFISKLLKDEKGLIISRLTLQSLNLFYCERSELSSIGYGVRRSGKMLELREFQNENIVYNKLLNEIENYILNNCSEDTIKEMKSQKIEAKQSGCYIATCVYGNYDCPQVWTLRRYRDNILSASWYGRAFIRTYYAISPKLVSWFGNTIWFKTIWKNKLDRIVKKLNSLGIEDNPYQDK